MDWQIIQDRSILEWIIYIPLALIPGLLWLYYFWRKDKYEPEPQELVIKVFLYGALTVPVAAGLQWLLWGMLFSGAVVSDFARTLRLMVHAFAVVALTEEFFKYLVVRLRMMPDPEFDEPMDGIVYAVSAGIGFATAENVLYMFQYGAVILVVRMLFAVFLHAGCSGLCGYYLGKAKFHPKHSKRHQAMGLFLAVIIHGLYDFIIFKKYLHGLILILLLLYGVKEYLEAKMDQALDASPFKDCPQAKGGEASPDAPNGKSDATT